MLFSAADLIAGRGTPVTARPTEPLAVALERMAERDYSQLPVVDEHDPPRALGIVTADSSIRAIRGFGAAIADLRVDEALNQSTRVSVRRGSSRQTR
jgi:CBS domain-containing protein